MPVYDLETHLIPFSPTAQTFDLGEGMMVQNQTAGGEILRSGGAARLWRGTLALAQMPNAEAGIGDARLHMLRGPGAAFLIRDYRRNTGFTAVLQGVQANGTVNINTGPPGAVIRAYDYIGFDYAGRRALHQVVTGVTLNGSGVINGIMVIPPVRPGWTAGANVTVGSARCMAVMVPGSLRIGTASNGATDGASFDWIQTLRQVT